jgi:hypothetical protein
MRYLRLAPALAALACLYAATARCADDQSDLAANAAIQYWQGIALMPVLDQDQQKILDEWKTAPLDDAAVKLIDSSQASMLYLRRGAKLPRCDWGLDHNDGLALLMPHLGKSRDLTRLAALHARYKFEQGNYQGAREDATAMMALARHVGRDPIMISVLVRCVLEGAVVDTVAPQVVEMKAPYAQAAQMYGKLPRAATLADAITREKNSMLPYIVKHLRDAERQKPGSWRDMWKEFLDFPGIPEEVKKIESLDEAVRQIEALPPVYDEMAVLVALPKAEFDARYPAFKQKTKAANPLAGTILPAIDKLLAQQHRAEARMAMLLAGIAIAESGPDKLHEFKDPFGDGPFEYRALDRGFELKSKLIFEDKPVTLVLGGKAVP